MMNTVITVIIILLFKLDMFQCSAVQAKYQL